MCGIVGYIGRQPVAPLLLTGLERLEYRGYDSAGIAVMGESGIEIRKSKGRLQALREQLEAGERLPGTVGIGHTRWATHGKPSDENSHPHGSARFAVVHNGIIENYARLKERLMHEGVCFTSQTDTEVVVHLLETLYDGDMLSTIRKAIAQLEGSYALGILCREHPDCFAAVRHSSPLVVGMGEDGNFIASDIPAMLAYTRSIRRLNDDEVALLKADAAEIYNAAGNEVLRETETITWDVTAAEKGGYEHFMLKEIMEQPEALQATISPRIGTSGEIVLDGVTLRREELGRVRTINIVACGSAYYAAMVGKYVIEELTRIPVDVDLASEFRYRNPIIDENSLTIIISQSGETADTLAALREAKARGARVLSIVNVVGSSIASESDDVLYTWAGPEIAVATSKGYSTQVTMMYILALYIARTLDKLDPYKLRRVLRALLALPDQISRLLSQTEKVRALAKRFASVDHAYYIGRNLDYAVALEGALKLKEISYVHAEAYAAGELKHGTISLVEEGTLVVALACCDRLLEKTLSNIKEVKARGAHVLALTLEGNAAMEQEADDVLYLPETHELLQPSLEVVLMQLFAYYIALERGCDIDKPRNLAKSVTVE